MTNSRIRFCRLDHARFPKYRRCTGRLLSMVACVVVWNHSIVIFVNFHRFPIWVRTIITNPINFSWNCLVWSVPVHVLGVWQTTWSDAILVLGCIGAAPKYHKILFYKTHTPTLVVSIPHVIVPHSAESVWSFFPSHIPPVTSGCCVSLHGRFFHL